MNYLKLICMIFVCSCGITLLISNFMELFFENEKQVLYYIIFSWFLFIFGFVGIIKNI